MPPQDAAWLGMERPTNLMVVTAVLVLDGAPDDEALTRVLSERLVDRHPPFRRRPVRPHRWSPRLRWRQDGAFDLGAHLTRLPVQAPVESVLDAVVADLLGTPLDLNRPPWQLHLVTDRDGGAALVLRVHHCVGDGSALVQVLLGLTDPVDAAVPGHPAATPGRRRRPSPVRLVRTAVGVVATLVRVPLTEPEPRHHLRGRLGTRKVVARGGDVPLVTVRRRPGTVNDVVLDAVTTGLRCQLLAGGDSPVDLRVLVPVDLRPRGAPVGPWLGNRFGLVFVTLPVGEPDPVRRATAVRDGAWRDRVRTEAVATFAGLTVLGTLPPAAQALAVRLLGARASAVVTNVRGPAAPVRLAGRRVDRITFFVPQTGAVGVGISVLSYAGSVTVGVCADAGLLPDPASLVRWIEDDLAGR